MTRIGIMAAHAFRRGRGQGNKTLAGSVCLTPPRAVCGARATALSLRRRRALGNETSSLSVSAVARTSYHLTRVRLSTHQAAQP